ncbi:hypothetical protein PROSTU_01965 [Providencia stuartii ATCC 25827]|uniref:Uncharacterized protein n=1 Tax=Providencia stuartii ATCC 25827 TaxID=471874 RepID=A0AA87CQ81_PROST|nr:hypothetical protein PROSTU_01965 [Providencia stuartii ATCC 25827]
MCHTSINVLCLDFDTTVEIVKKMLIHKIYTIEENKEDHLI